MELSPLFKESHLVPFDDPERIAGIRSTHVVVLPQGWELVRVAEPDEHFAAAQAFDMDMGGWCSRGGEKT
jgi:hypothetical protein